MFGNSLKTSYVGVLMLGLACAASALAQQANLYSKGVVYDGQTFEDWVKVFQSGTKAWPRNPDYNQGGSVYFATRLSAGTSNQTIPADTPLFVSLGSGLFADEGCNPDSNLLLRATNSLDDRMARWSDRRVWLDGVEVNFDHEASRLDLEFEVLFPPGTRLPCDPTRFSQGPLPLRAASSGIFALIPPLEPGPHVLKYGHSSGSFRYRRFTVQEGLIGDLDRNGELDATDVNLIATGAREGSVDLRLDVNRNGVVDAQDHRHWVETLAESALGDANLDGEVNFVDFLSLSSSFGGNGGWAEGDFDGNGEVGFADFLHLSENFGRGIATATSVPEPMYSAFGLAGLVLAALSLRSKRT